MFPFNIFRKKIGKDTKEPGANTDTPYQGQRAAIAKQKAEVQKMVDAGFNGIPVCAVLKALPKNTLVNIHFQWLYDQKYRHVTASEALDRLDAAECMSRVHHINIDGDYIDGNPDRPIAILEIPRSW